jgi:hypothetical protein
VKPTAGASVTVFVRVCARCAQDHEVVFNELAKPVEHEGASLTHAGVCPWTGAEVLMRVVDDGESSQ